MEVDYGRFGCFTTKRHNVRMKPTEEHFSLKEWHNMEIKLHIILYSSGNELH
jgi:hypothetical protein